MNSSAAARQALLMVHQLSLRLAPFYMAQDNAELARRIVEALLAAAVAGVALLKGWLAVRAQRPAGRGDARAMAVRRVVPARFYGAVLVLAAAVSLLHPAAAVAGERAWLARADIETSLLGKPLLSRNLASGSLSHWEFRRDGTVEASRGGLGRASGTWALHDDGQMCVTMVGRTGCRYWFRKEGGFANADTNAPDAATVAEVRFE